MPHKPQFNFSEGVLQKMAQYATEKISREEMIKWLYAQGTENPEQFLKDRERLFGAIRSVVEHYRKAPESDAKK